MALLFDGIKVSIDYTDLIQEFKEELEDGMLTNEDYVYIVRDKANEFNYEKVIDWFYLEDKEQIEQIDWLNTSKIQVKELMIELIGVDDPFDEFEYDFIQSPMKRILNNKGMSAYYLHKQTGIPKQTINDVVSGKTDFKNMKLENAFKIAEVLEMPIDALFKLIYIN